MGVTHTFVSAIGDGGDTSLVRPSDWNAGHAFTNYVGVEAAADVDLTSASTFYDILSLTVTTGKWFVTGQTRLLTSSSSVAWVGVVLAQGGTPTIFATTWQYTASPTYEVTLTVSGVYVASGSTSIYLRGYTDNSAGSPRGKAFKLDAFATGISTRLTALQVGT